MKRLLILVPFAAVFAVVFGLYYAWAGLNALMQGNSVVGTIFFIYGLGGLVLATALWRSYRDYRKRLREKQP
jgi:hypothetical protein